MYYNEKSNWEQETGVNSSSTTVGAILDIAVAVGSFAMVLWIWASFIDGFSPIKRRLEPSSLLRP